MICLWPVAVGLCPRIASILFVSMKEGTTLLQPHVDTPFCYNM